MSAADYTGARSGASRVNPVGYRAGESRYLICAFNGEAPSNPARYHKPRGKPEVRNRGRAQTIDVVATKATGQERERLFRRGADRFPDLAEHARKTDRDIPVIVLIPITGA